MCIIFKNFKFEDICNFCSFIASVKFAEYEITSVFACNDHDQVHASYTFHFYWLLAQTTEIFNPCSNLAAHADRGNSI